MVKNFSFNHDPKILVRICLYYIALRLKHFSGWRSDEAKTKFVSFELFHTYLIDKKNFCSSFWHVVKKYLINVNPSKKIAVCLKGYLQLDLWFQATQGYQKRVT